jgi:radical SAM protein with 4Fe4S-binding SPASM domain
MFSIIMPVWNRGAVVAEAIKSVLAQTRDDYELIIVDDGSEDNTGEVLQPYCSDKVRYFRIPHGGVSKARNFGLRQATHPYVAYLDSDNAWHPQFLQEMQTAMVAASASVAYCQLRILRWLDGAAAPVADGIHGRPFCFDDLCRANYIDQNSLVHRRDLLEQTGAFDETLTRLVDWDLVLRLALVAPPLHVPKILGDYHFGRTANAITAREPLEPNVARIRQKLQPYLDPTLVHDGVPYVYADLSPAKRYNLARWRSGFQDRQDFQALALPSIIQIEPSSRCTLKCPKCPAGTQRLNRHRDMTLQEFTAIIDELQDSLMFIVLWDWGEPFMNPELPAMIRQAADRGIKTVTSTNAHFLEDPAYLQAVLQSGLDSLIVAIDSADAGRYADYRRNGSLRKACDGVRRLVSLKKQLHSPTQINLRMVLMKSNEDEIDAMQRLARQLDVDLLTAKSVNPLFCGEVNHDMIPTAPAWRRLQYRDGQPVRREHPTCDYIWTIANIHSDGEVASCCEDFNGQFALGNVFTSGFKHIWNNEAYRQRRRAITADLASQPICSGCWRNYQVGGFGFAKILYDRHAAVPAWRHCLRRIKTVVRALVD